MWLRGAVAAAVMAVTTRALPQYGASLSFGTLSHCEGARACSWVGIDGELVGAEEMMRQLMESEQMDIHRNVEERRRLEEHMHYLEDVHHHAMEKGVRFTYRMGVNSRHLYLDGDRDKDAQQFVHQEYHARVRRRLEAEPERDEQTKRLLESLPASLNWCSLDNPKQKSVCSPIKSQNKCGSCWAFAATDAIETAVAVGSGEDARALSPQQFLDCSTRQMTTTFQYCWASSGVNGAKWLEKEMKWASKNDACDGGMTHAAFADAAQLHLGLMSQLDLPYTETTTEIKLGLTGWKTTTEITEKNETARNASCARSPETAAASISDWSQAVGKDCSQTSDATVLLKTALQNQPISVAINSGETFKDYKGGIYECPDNGDFSDSSKVDHAVVLVGYGNEDSTDYWLLKNSYSSQWGDKGYLKLKMDSKINCGINIFPVIPLGAKAGAANSTVDGGGDKTFVGLSPTMWIAVACVVTIATVVLTAFGVIISNRRRAAMQDAIMH
ncbi:hypothetical protein Poli38472_000661 [Pythium oligandrum]|uniref:Peptidase C1A papain C-terminal domain-containing protein n=1 Tax=Pythium oligandrum TaxID=41045 RepID=A0A8K1CCP5_PYTOL|nr:hypothetical protein Poli38472_000661 [Pythium oligandrum]|eukprot:TMW60619.1 hypothetical protein Poli38472_000661 [Pythium oligandrum]